VNGEALKEVKPSVKKNEICVTKKVARSYTEEI